MEIEETVDGSKEPEQNENLVELKKLTQDPQESHPSNNTITPTKQINNLRNPSDMDVELLDNNKLKTTVTPDGGSIRER